MRQAMKAHFTIYMKIGEEEVNLSPFISKNSVSFNSNLCSTGWKSVTDTASMTLTFNDRNVAKLQEILAYLVSAQQAFPPVAVNVRIAQGDITVFRGKLDLGKLSVSSSKLPGTISLSAKSKMEDLDVKPQNNFALWPGTVGDAVNRCLRELSLPSVSSWAPGIEKRELEVPFVVTEDDSDTWRNRIDTLLCEMGGYVLTYDHATDTFAVSKVNDPNKEVPETFVRYLVSSQLKSGSTRFSKDGVVVIYRNVKSESDQIMYMKDISLGKDEATGDTVGEWVEPGAFFPEDADVTKTFEEYDSGILDRGNLLETSRKQNSHMGIYFLDPNTTKIEITASDANYKGVSDWYSNDSFYSPEGGFTYPAGGEFYPTKAWIALKNKTEGKINVTDFRISGKVWYSDAEYRMVMPLACKDPEEYSSSYISKQETAKEYANFLMNIKRFGGDTSTWTERWEEHSIGDKVLIRHKSGSTITAVVVRKQTRTMGDELWADMTAVSLDGWKLTEDSGVKTNSKGVSVLDEYGQAKLNGYTGTREQWLARNDIYYLWSASEEKLIAPKNMLWRISGVGYMRYKGFLFGDFSLQDWMKDWSQVMKEKSDRYPYLWAKVGVDGEPFLLQGMSGEKGDNIISSNEYYISNYDILVSGGYWEDTAENWIFGKYIWRRTKYINQDTGEVNYSAEYFDSALTEIYKRKLQWDFIVDPSIAKVNRRLSIDDVVFSISTNIQYYGNVVPIWRKNGEEFTEGLRIGVNETGKVKIDMVHPSDQNICFTRYIEIVDETEQAIELSPVETVEDLPQRTGNGDYLVKGDYCIVKRTDGKFRPQLYEVKSVDSNGVATWIESKDNLKIASVTREIVAIAKELKDRGEDIDYYDSLYAFNAYITNAFVETLTVATMIGNDIKSSNFSPGEQGYRLRAKEGTLECMNGVFAGEVSVDHAFIYKGIFKTDRFYPQEF